jgi:hypothetical protein
VKLASNGVLMNPVSNEEHRMDKVVEKWEMDVDLDKDHTLII